MTAATSSHGGRMRVARAGRLHALALSVALLLLSGLWATGSAAAAAGAITNTAAASLTTAPASTAAPATSAGQPASAPATSGGASATPPAPAPTTTPPPTTAAPAPGPSTSPTPAPAPTTPGTAATSTTPAPAAASITPAPAAASTTPPPSPSPASTPADQPCSATPGAPAQGAGTTSGAAGSSSAAISTAPAGAGSLSCGAQPAVASVTGTPATSGAAGPGDVGSHDQPGVSQGQGAGSSGGSTAAPAAQTPQSAGGRPRQAHPTLAIRAQRNTGPAIHLLSRFPAVGTEGAHHTRSRSAGAAQTPVATAGGQARCSATHAALANPLLSVTGDRAPMGPAASSGGSRISPKSLVTAPGETVRHARHSGAGASPVVDAPAQPNISPQGPGGRPTRGVGVAASGGAGAPSSLMVRIGFACVAASWLAGVTGESIHLQFPVTHRLERPG